ncbi:MAG: hypothetical protein MN733_19335, partial [Nitrososphaera sp.]|nr:hypothetical protein [Nitrososphaera sp.]
MAGYVYQNVDLSTPITKVLMFPSSISVQAAHWTKTELPLTEEPWYVKAMDLAVSKPLINNEWLLGIEIEAENVKITSFVEAVGESNYTVWGSKPDNSLRNNGMEFVSIPMKGAMVHKALCFLAYA